MTDPAVETATVADDRIKVTEVFHSLQGEALFSGWPTVFIRLTGCPLRCHYCDTPYAFGGGDWKSIPELIAEAKACGTRHVCVTGGEPLAQPRCLNLLRSLCDAGFDVSLETSGAIDIGPVDSRVCRVVDFKTPGSGEMERNLERNFDHLAAHDAIKFVICDRADYDWSRNWLAAREAPPCTVLFSPSHEELPAQQLADWILEDRLDVRLQVQLHKLLWGDGPGH